MISFSFKCFWRKFAADNDLPATWSPHTQTKDEVLRAPRKNTNPKTGKSDMFGVPFTPILPSIHVTRNENGKSSPPSKVVHNVPG